MTQLGRQLDFAQKALSAERLREVGFEHLDRDLAIVLEVAREVHGGHATLPKFAFNAIAVGQHHGESRPVGAHFDKPVTGATQMLLCGSCSVKYNRPACIVKFRALSPMGCSGSSKRTT